MIPQSFIQDLLARTDIVGLIERYVPLKKSGANHFGRCPFHDEKTASFSVSASKQFYHCFSCGANGNAIGFLMAHSQLGFVEAVNELAAQAGVEVPREHGARAAPPPAQDLFDILQRAAGFYRQQLQRHPPAQQYLASRGLNAQQIERFNIGYVPNERQALRQAFPDYDHPRLVDAGLVIAQDDGRRYDRFRNRIIFPICDRRERIIGFGGRLLGSGEPKYLNSPETELFIKGRELYGLSLAQKAIRQQGYALVVEGYMDVVSLARAGIENAVATLGTATNLQHIRILSRLSARIVFCFDGDAAGRRAAWRALEESLAALRDDLALVFLFLPAEHDPDSFVREHGAPALQAAADKAAPLTDFFLDALSAEVDLHTAEGRAQLLHKARPLIERMTQAPILRLQILNSLAQRSQLTTEQIEAVWHNNALPATSAPPPARGGASASPPPRYRSALRQPPASTEEVLLRVLLQNPVWAARVPIGLINADSAQGMAIIALIDAVSVGDIESATTAAQLAERYRESPHAAAIDRALTAMMADNVLEGHNEAVFEDALHKLQHNAVTAEIQHLTQKARQQPLSAQEKNRLTELLGRKSTTAEAARQG